MTNFLKIILLVTVFYVQNISAMTWELANKADHRFVISFFPEKISSETRVNSDIFCRADSLRTLPSEQQKLFRKSTGETESQRTFQKFGYEFVYSLFKYAEEESTDESEELNLVLDDQRLVCEGTPTEMSCEELNEIIKMKNVIFYTGAGISAAAVPTMNVLLNALKISKDLEEGDKLQHYISDVISNPEKYTEILGDFFDRCEKALPTFAHVLLSECSKKFNHLLVTENVDQLHQKSGIEPIIFAGSDRYSSDERITALVKEADYIVTIGLNSDESGFLKFYKAQNPKGKIISINLAQTNYLSNEDFYLEGDIQKLAKKIFEL